MKPWYALYVFLYTYTQTYAAKVHLHFDALTLDIHTPTQLNRIVR